MARRLFINEHLAISISELQFRFARSSGKGGQNVNKVETRVELLFDVTSSPSLSKTQRDRIFHELKSYIDSEGTLRLVAQESRSQWKNREGAVGHFVELLRKALTPRKKRIATKIPTEVREKRLEKKKLRGEIKRLRRVNSDH
jgi:ribosome-associated protein